MSYACTQVSPILGNTRERRKRSLSEQMVIDKTATLYFRDNVLLVHAMNLYSPYIIIIARLM